MTKEIEYAEVRVLVGKDDQGAWQADVANEKWGAENFWDWDTNVPPRRLLLRVPIQEPHLSVVTLPENPSEDVKVEVAA